ncbi:hypothetical protein V8C40DRAFT_229637 [Trichoderma camerunense]
MFATLVEWVCLVLRMSLSSRAVQMSWLSRVAKPSSPAHAILSHIEAFKIDQRLSKTGPSRYCYTAYDSTS